MNDATLSREPLVPFIFVPVPRDDLGDNMMSIQAQTLDSEPMVVIKHIDSNGQPMTTSIPYYIARDINESLFEEAKRTFDNAIKLEKQFFHHPTSVESRLVSSKLPNYAKGNKYPEPEVLVHEDDLEEFLAGEKYIPYLIWVRHHPILAPNSYFEHSAMGRAQEGWALRLTGFLMGALSYARWDDKEVIISTVKAMEDRESLLVMAALRYPDEAERIATLYNLKDILDKCRKNADFSRYSIETIFSKSKVLLCSERKAPNYSAHIDIHCIIMDDDDTAIAYGLDIPRRPKFQDALEGLLSDFNLDIDIEVGEAWGNVFVEEAQSQGWLIVDRETGEISTEHDVGHPRGIWFTKLSQDEWNRLAPLLHSYTDYDRDMIRIHPQTSYPAIA